MKPTINRIGDKEKDYVLEVLDTDFRSSAGSNMMQRFEADFAKKFG